MNKKMIYGLLIAIMLLNGCGEEYNTLQNIPTAIESKGNTIQKLTTEAEIIKNSINTLSWAYYLDKTAHRWYISPVDTSKKVKVYSLMGFKNHKNGWGTVGYSVASFNLSDSKVTIKNIPDSENYKYYDIGWGEWNIDKQIQSDIEMIRNSTVDIKWWFFQATNEYWYIINESGTVLRFSSKIDSYGEERYDWINIDMGTDKPIFFIEDNKPKMKYGDISLLNKPYSQIDSNDMFIRYKNSLNYYNLHKEELDKEGITFSESLAYTGTIFDNNALGNISSLFYIATWSKASEALDRFLDASGNNINIDIEDTLEEGGAKKFVYSAIWNAISDGNLKGTIEIKQWQWGTDDYSIGLDEKYAFGTLRIQWERDKDKNVVLFVNDIYSFDISDYTKDRQTIPLYKNAVDLVLAGKSSDFYFTGRTSKISKQTIYDRAIEGGAKEK